MPRKTTLEVVLAEAVRSPRRRADGTLLPVYQPAEVLDWDEVRARQEQLYADTLRARFMLGTDADVLAYEPLLARIMGVLPPDNFVAPVDRYHHAGLIAQRVMEARQKAPRGWRG